MLRNPIKLTSRARGFSLIEVLLAIVVLSVGLLALAALQGGLVRNSADSKSRSTASTIAKDTIEDFRDFNTGSQYNAIADSGATTITRGGTSYSRTVTVSRYVLNADPNDDGDTTDGGFAINANDTAAIVDTPEFKLVDVNVSWVGAAGDTQRVRYFDTISSIDPTDAALAITPKPPVVRRDPEIRIFTPSEEGIIPIAIGDDTQAAASNPRPQQFTEGVTGTTRFSVQTYLEDQTNPLLQQRLDVAATTCVCELDGTTSTDSNLAFEPSFWDGLEYTTPLGVAGKTTAAESNVSQDPVLCGDCCRNHHDKSASQTLFDPFRPSGDYTSGNHNHYDEDGVLASSNGDEYIESCRMVRVDGIFRVATDTRMENFALLEMDNTSGIAVIPAATVTQYGNFAVDFVTAAVNALPGDYPATLIPDQLVNAGAATALASTYESLLDIDNAGVIDYIGDDKVGVSPDPALNVGDLYNMHARGLYIDYISDDAKFAISCIGNTSNFECEPYTDKELLELVPFLAINLTNLSEWDQADLNVIELREDAIPVDVEDAFVRGEVSAKDNGTTQGEAFAFGGNSGLTNEPPSDPDDESRVLTDFEVFKVGTGIPTPVLPDPFTIQVATLTGLDRDNLNVSIVVPTLGVGGVDAPCGGSNSGQYECDYEDNDDFEVNSITLQFGNYNILGNCPGGFDSTVAAPCICKKTGKPDYDRWFNFQLVSVNPQNPMSAGTATVSANNGAIGELSQITISAPGITTLETNGLSGDTITATFSRQTGSTCPAGTLPD